MITQEQILAAYKWQQEGNRGVKIKINYHDYDSIMCYDYKTKKGFIILEGDKDWKKKLL